MPFKGGRLHVNAVKRESHARTPRYEWRRDAVDCTQHVGCRHGIGNVAKETAEARGGPERAAVEVEARAAAGGAARGPQI